MITKTQITYISERTGKSYLSYDECYADENNLPTARAFYDNSAGIEDVTTIMVNYARLIKNHALLVASKNARVIDDPNSYTGNTGSEYPPDQIVDKNSIINSFPDKLIREEDEIY